MQAKDRLPVYSDLAGKVAVVTGGSGGWWPIARRFRDGRTETWWGAPLPIGRRGLGEQVAFDWKSANQLTSLAGTKPRMWVLDGNLTAFLTRLFVSSASHCLVGHRIRLQPAP